MTPTQKIEKAITSSTPVSIGVFTGLVVSMFLAGVAWGTLRSDVRHLEQQLEHMCEQLDAIAKKLDEDQ